LFFKIFFDKLAKIFNQLV